MVIKKSTWLAVLVACGLSASVAHAQATRTWVSGVGDDVNPCSRTAPCKTFAGAISKTAAGGEISVLDPGGFGGVTITKAITLNGDGTLASILSSGTNGIVVNAGPNDIVRIRNISINGAGTTLGTNGIRYLAGKHLIVESCWLQNFSNNAIDVSLTAAGNLTVKDTRIARCGQFGVLATTTGGVLTMTLDEIDLRECNTGVDLVSGNGTISRSTISNMAVQGLATVGSAVLNAESCVISNCGIGLQSSTTSVLRISNCDILQNGTNLTVTGGVPPAGFGVISFQNNKMAGNTTTNAASSFLSATQ